MQTRFILIEPSHAGNVGATARAMKVMGFSELVLVKPRWANVLNREETIQRASGALDVLKHCRIVDTLDDALDGAHVLCATAMTPRDFGPPSGSPRQVLAQVASLQNSEQKIEPIVGQSGDLASNSPPRRLCVAFLFGTERFGMKNEDVYRCHHVLTIPTNPAFGSLNLAAAVQVIAYEWRMALGGFASDDPPAETARADARAVAGTIAHLEQALTHIGFHDPQVPKKLLPRLNTLFNRAGLQQEEVHILRGIAKTILETTAQNGSKAQRGKPD
jgi:tRNA/rRNA methyltransferase